MMSILSLKIVGEWCKIWVWICGMLSAKFEVRGES